MQRICAITGASGYIARHCAAQLRLDGWQVVKMGRDSARNDIPFVLGSAPHMEQLRGIDALLHCAYDYSTRSWEEEQTRNVDGSVSLLETASAAGIKKIVFLSSVSAFHGCRSFYGRGKLIVEEAVRRLGGVSLRPGLVYGEPGRGMFGALERLAQLPLLPIFDGGHQPMVLVHVQDLARAIGVILGQGPEFFPAPITVAHPQPVEFIDILRCIAAGRGRQLRTFSIPGSLGLFLLSTAERLGVHGKFRSDSLRGLLYPNPRPDFGETERLGITFRSFDKGCVGGQ